MSRQVIIKCDACGNTMEADVNFSLNEIFIETPKLIIVGEIVKFNDRFIADLDDELNDSEEFEICPNCINKELASGQIQLVKRPKDY